MTAEPDYSQYSPSELHDAALHIDREAYPDRWARLQSEIAARGSDRSLSSDQDHVLGVAGFAILHIVLCPVLSVILVSLLEGDGEGSGWLVLIGLTGVVPLSIASAAWYDRFRRAELPGVFLLGSIAATVVAGSAVPIAGVFLLAWVARALF